MLNRSAEAALGGVGVGEQFGGRALAASGQRRARRFFPRPASGEEFGDREVQSGVVGLAAHQVGDGEGEHADDASAA